MRLEIIKLIEKNMRKMILNINLGDDFLNITPKTQAKEEIIKKQGHNKVKKNNIEIINKMKI